MITQDRPPRRQCWGIILGAEKLFFFRDRSQQLWQRNSRFHHRIADFPSLKLSPLKTPIPNTAPSFPSQHSTSTYQQNLLPTAFAFWWPLALLVFYSSPLKKQYCRQTMIFSVSITLWSSRIWAHNSSAFEAELLKEAVNSVLSPPSPL